MISTLSIADLGVEGRRVLVRADLNVPLRDGAVADDFKIQAAMPTIQALRSAGAQVVVCSHLGRPNGVDPELRMDPVAARLGELGSFQVDMAHDVAGPGARSAVESATQGTVVMLENTRFEAGETANDPDLAAAFVSLADCFVIDAFGSAHRAHSSTVGVAERLPSAASELVRAEVAALSKLLDEPDRPYVVLLGGAKISGKLAVMKALLPKVDAMLVGGGMCFTLLKAEGFEIGGSLVEDAMLGEVSEVLAGMEGGKIMLPTDVAVGDAFSAEAERTIVPASDIPEGSVGLDIGPETVERFTSILHNAENVFWNGPMGVFEWEPYRLGTAGIAAAIASSPGFTVVGGGDSVAALRILGAEGDVSHLSTGGGAGLEFLEGRQLPALVALERWANG